jgi:hypothetical protein
MRRAENKKPNRYDLRLRWQEIIRTHLDRLPTLAGDHKTAVLLLLPVKLRFSAYYERFMSRFYSSSIKLDTGLTRS